MAITAKENILKKIRSALSQSTPIPFADAEGHDSTFQLQTQDSEVEFAENFTELLGVFSYCANEQEMVQQLQTLLQKKLWDKIFCSDAKIKETIASKWLQPINWFNDLANCHASITGTECLVARTGSMVLSSKQTDGRTASVYAPVHICIAYTSQLVYDVKDALQLMKEKYGNEIPSLLSFATGPSRTADIEKTLVVGVHGPKEVYVFLIDG